MFYRKSGAIVAITASLFLSSCAANNSGEVAPSPEIPKVIEHNALSGRVGTDGPVLVVKIDDTPSSRPQISVDQADVVYIEQVEGGLTRLAAVFSSEIPDIVGPVRSARITDLELFAQYGHIAFAYSGAQTKLRPYIKAANLEDVGASTQGPNFYTNDPNRMRPYAMILAAKNVMAKVIAAGATVESSKSAGWKFSTKIATGGIAIDSVKLRWPAQSYEVIWSATENRWHMAPGGDVESAASGVILGPTTLVIQNVLITPSQFHDKFGGITPFSATVGTGTGYILRDGQYFAATWSRPTALDGTTWTGPDGVEIKFAPGQIWIALTDHVPEFTLHPVPAPTPTSK
ncbi:unannotated protein [freshwater metagenome]|uniref:Unannotated protein n=1 Tax=freshwater metagenome TaxID=449393 RepID=A0A6J7XY54_9ZZZZ|nr:DUF3048 domain-containing protein [Actinomycetota bacterium]